MTNHTKDQHGSFNGVTLHENAKFLYLSRNAANAVKWSKVADWAVVISFLAWGSGQHLSLLPMLIFAAMSPRRWVQQQHFTWAAWMCPHTEQVTFFKTKPFGGIDRFVVDIKDLEKVEADAVGNSLMWFSNMFDQNMVFRDMQSGEVFVFDKEGIWNEETLCHPLLN